MTRAFGHCSAVFRVCLLCFFVLRIEQSLLLGDMTSNNAQLFGQKNQQSYSQRIPFHPQMERIPSETVG